MPLILCSHDENYAWLNKRDDNRAVRLQNPKTAEYQIVRTSLLPGLLKTVRENKRHSVPMKIFEVADVGLKDEKAERRSRNERRFAACWYGKTSGFEQVHGLLDRVMLMLKSAFVTREDGIKDPKLQGYWIEEVDGMFSTFSFFYTPRLLALRGSPPSTAPTSVPNPSAPPNGNPPLITSLRTRPDLPPRPRSSCDAAARHGVGSTPHRHLRHPAPGSAAEIRVALPY